MSQNGYSVNQGSTLTGIDSADSSVRIGIQRALFRRRTKKIQNITQSGDAQAFATPVSTSLTSTVLAASTRFVYTLSNGWGWYEVSSDMGATFDEVSVLGNVASLSGSRIDRISTAVLSRSIGFRDVTSTDDAAPNSRFEHGRSSFNGSIFGFVQSNETPMDDDPNVTPSTLVLPLGSGTVTGSAFIPQDDQTLDYYGGGPMEFRSPFRLSASVTIAGTPFDIVTFDAALNLDNGQTVSGKCILTSLRCDLDYDGAGKVPFAFSGLFTELVTFA